MVAQTMLAREIMTRIAVIAMALFAASPISTQKAAADDNLGSVRQQADRTSTAAQQARRDADAALDAGARVEGLIDDAESGIEEFVEGIEPIRGARQLEGEVEATRNLDRDLDARAAAEMERTEPVREARQLEGAVEHTMSADDRARAAIEREARAVEREVDSATDVEQQARARVAQTEAVTAGQAAQQELEQEAAASERAGQEVRQTRDRLRRALGR
jgi:hypothetical protein